MRQQTKAGLQENVRLRDEACQEIARARKFQPPQEQLEVHRHIHGRVKKDVACLVYIRYQ